MTDLQRETKVIRLETVTLVSGWLKRQIDKARAGPEAAERLLGLRDYSQYNGDDDQHAKDIELVAREYLQMIREKVGGK